MATTENYVLKDGQLVPDESVITRTNVGKVPNLDIQLKPMITDNNGSSLPVQTTTDIDWNLNLNIINVGGFRGFGKRKALRNALNASKNTLIWNGNGFQRVNTGLGADKWSRRDVRRLMKSYNDNWSTINNTQPEEGNSADYAAYLSENYLANNPTATNFRWVAGKYPLQLVTELLNNESERTISDPYLGFRNADWLTVDYSHRKNSVDPSDIYLLNNNNINKRYDKEPIKLDVAVQLQIESDESDDYDINSIILGPSSDRANWLLMKYPFYTTIKSNENKQAQNTVALDNNNNNNGSINNFLNYLKTIYLIRRVL